MVYFTKAVPVGLTVNLGGKFTSDEKVHKGLTVDTELIESVPAMALKLRIFKDKMKKKDIFSINAPCTKKLSIIIKEWLK